MYRPQNTRFFLALLALSLVFAACGDEQGTLSGTVRFKGLPCQPGQPDFRVPPCTGPYSSYEIVIYSPADLESPVVTTMTDGTGSYKLDLPVGEYIIFTQDGPEESNRKENRFRIDKDAVTALSLQINTGIL